MRTARVSLTLDESLLVEARTAVGARNLSGYINQALRLQLQHDRLASLLADLAQTSGPISTKVKEEVQ